MSESNNLDTNNLDSNVSNAEESIVDGVRRELEDIDASDLSEHTARFEALHK